MAGADVVDPPIAGAVGVGFVVGCAASTDAPRCAFAARLTETPNGAARAAPNGRGLAAIPAAPNGPGVAAKEAFVFGGVDAVGVGAALYR